MDQKILNRNFFSRRFCASLRADEIKLWLTPSNQSLVIVCTQANFAPETRKKNFPIPWIPSCQEFRLQSHKSLRSCKVFILLLPSWERCQHGSIKFMIKTESSNGEICDIFRHFSFVRFNSDMKSFRAAVFTTSHSSQMVVSLSLLLETAFW